MRYLSLYLLSVALLACHGQSMPEVRGLRVRQETTATSAPPPTSTASDSGRPTEGPTLGASDSASSTDTPESGRSSDSSESSDPSSTRVEPASSSDAPASETAEDSAAATTEVPNLGPSQTSGAPASATSEADEAQQLPIPPRITPAFGFTGVVLILTGIGYGLIGVKHRLVQIFLSNGYLAALAVTVLVDYVMKPPISDAVQGAYFVAAFMTGSIYGGGALIFKEVTEGFGCLLGGFCLAMWFLCLKPGGLIADQTGKGIMIGVFCVAVWALSWSHWTRSYGLIGSTSFAGATAFVLGVDCFSRAGLKEFWFYIWELNDDLFPLGTTTYPMTRGMIVELIAIVLVTIIGILSQIKLWKIVRERRQRRDAVRLEDERRQEVVEEAIGRHLERQNDRDRGAWEKQYGNTLNAKRSTILWTEAHPEKTVTHITPYEVKRLSSTDSLEMSSVGGSRSRRSKHASKSKGESSVTVNAIPEETEEAVPRTSTERQKALVALDPAAPTEVGAVVEQQLEAGESSKEASSPTEKVDKGPEVIPLPFRTPVANGSQSSLPTSVESNRSNRLQEPKDAKKRRSLLSLLSRSPRLSTSSDQLKPSESQDRLAADTSVESLALPSRRSSRASSLAATLDEANDMIDLKRVSRMIDFDSMPGTPSIVVSPVEASEEGKKEYISLKPAQSLPEAPPSPTEVQLELEEDPEELSRPVEQPTHKETKAAQQGSTISGSSERHGSDSSAQQQTTGPSSVADGLTKGALEQVPSQVSHVVMSYRTNEWAKHIADAEAPMFAEPEQIKAEDSEPAVQLATPGASSSTAAPASDAASSKESAPTEVKRTLSASSSPPPPHVASSTSEGIVANVQEPQRTISRSATTPVVAHVPVIASPPAARPSLKGKRYSTGNRSTTAIKPIQENEVTSFVRSPSRQQSSTPTPQRVMSPTHGAPASVNRLSTGSQSQLQSPLQSHPPQPYSVSRNTSRSSLQGTTPGALSRSASYMSGVTLPTLTGGRSETRLDMYESRQPQKRDLDSEQQRREALLTEWRISQQAHGSSLGGPGASGGGLINQISDRAGVEARRAQMLLDREHQRLMDDQERATRQHKQLAMDQVMRRPEMQGLHREAMRKMQARVDDKGKAPAA